MKIRMTLLSDTIFGNGMSVPGGEDISVLTDAEGFPYYKGSTLKGIFREELENYYSWTQDSEGESKAGRMLGISGSDLNTEQLIFSNLELSDYVKNKVRKELQGELPETITAIMTNTRIFTAIDETTGVAKNGSLRMAKCVNRGMEFYGSIETGTNDESLVKEILSYIKWIGSMRNKGYGHVQIEVVKESER